MKEIGLYSQNLFSTNIIEVILMAMPWRENEQIHLLNAIPLYRQRIVQKDMKNPKDLKEARRITLELAKEILSQNPDVNGRSDNAIYERLPYLENLLAGVFEKHHYATKDQSLYASNPRDNGDREPNLCNTRHKYKGAMTEYLKTLKFNQY